MLGRGRRRRDRGLVEGKLGVHLVGDQVDAVGRAPVGDGAQVVLVVQHAGGVAWVSQDQRAGAGAAVALEQFRGEVEPGGAGGGDLYRGGAEWLNTCRTVMSPLPFYANSGEYAATGSS